MKLKAAVHTGISQELLDALNAPGLREIVLDEVLDIFGAASLGPAEFYIQQCDIATGTQPMCEVRLTGVSATKKRTGEKFLQARQALEKVYQDLIHRHHRGSDIQLMVSIMADSTPSGLTSPLVEREADAAIWIRGRRD